MMKYQRRPMVVEAERYDPANVSDWLAHFLRYPNPHITDPSGSSVNVCDGDFVVLEEGEKYPIVMDYGSFLNEYLMCTQGFYSFPDPEKLKVD